MFRGENSKIPESKREEFARRVEEIFQRGGMMKVEPVRLFGKEIVTLRKVAMTEKGMDFHYNYFEETPWESAGFNMEECRIWSGKIGWSFFHDTVVAAYVLEETYHDGIAVAMVDGDPVTSWKYVGWLNYLFHEERHVKNYDPWKLFEAYYDSEEGRHQRSQNFWFGNTRYALIGGCEIYAVLHDTRKTIDMFDEMGKEPLENAVIYGMKGIIDNLKQYMENANMEQENQLQELMTAIRRFYEMEKVRVNALPFENEDIKKLIQSIFLCDAPAFAVKAVAEEYDKDFWALWEEVKDITGRKFTDLYGNDGYYVLPISTQEFFGISDDDLIFYWEEGDNIEFSEELQAWFQSLQCRYEEILAEESDLENPLRYIIDLMEEADETYFQILTFADFFEETLNHMNDMRYQTLWKLYDEMIHDAELKKAGDVIFVPDGPGHESEGLHYWGEQPKRRLTTNWEFMKKELKQNKGRQTLRRYNALLVNKPLRCKVFGF